MSRFRLSPRAKTDLADIRRYIAQDNASAADRFVGEFFDLFQLLAGNPEIGQQRDELRPNLRSISHGQYVVFFYPMQDGVEIVACPRGTSIQTSPPTPAPRQTAKPDYLVDPWGLYTILRLDVPVPRLGCSTVLYLSVAIREEQCSN